MKSITLKTKWWVTIMGNNNDILKALADTPFREQYLNMRTVIDTDGPEFVSTIIGMKDCNELLTLCSFLEPLKRLPATLINFYCNSVGRGANIHLRLATEDGNDDELVIDEIWEREAIDKLIKIQAVLNEES